MPSADQVPIKLPHLTMLRPKWVVLIAGSTGSALRAVRPPNLHITPVVRRDLVYRASWTERLIKPALARSITSKRSRRWLHRLRAECPGSVPLWAAHFGYGELPCIL